MVMLAGESSRTREAFLSVANSLEVPMVNWDLMPSQPSENSISK